MSVMLPEYRPHRRQPRQNLWFSALLLALLSASLVLLCKKFLSFDGGSAVVWFADAVAIAFLYRHPFRNWPLLAAAFWGSCTLAGMVVGFEAELALKYSFADVTEVLVAAALLRHFCPEDNYFDGLEAWLRFTFFSAGVPPLASAGIGSAIAASWSGSAFMTIFPSWYIADSVGILVLLPIALLVHRGSFMVAPYRRELGRFLLVGFIALMAIQIIFQMALLPFVFVSLPLIWVASRLPLLQTLVVIFCSILLLALQYVGIEQHYMDHLVGENQDRVSFAVILAIFAAAVPAYVMAVYTNIERNRNARIVEVESSFRAAVEKSRIGMLLISLDGRILKANRSFCDFLQYSEQELIGRDIFDIIFPDDHPAIEEIWLEFIREYREAPHVEKRYVRKDGRVVWGYLSCCLARDIHGAPLYGVAQVEDIDWRKRSEANLIETKERLQVTLSSIADAVIATDVNECVNFMNPVAEQMTGVTLQQARNKHVESVFHITQGRDGRSLSGPVSECLDQGTAVYGSEGAVLHSRDGRVYDIKNSASPLKTSRGELLGAVMVFQDVSESRQLIRQLSYKASHDDLTGLPNRDAFKRELLKAIESVRDSDECHSLAYIDLDRFKVINDSAGHLAGDALLKKISKYLRGLLQTSDSVARLGGDEFGVLFRHCGKEQARLRCEQLIRQIVTLRFPWNERIYDVGASVGITEINRRNHRLGDLLSQADVACYSAKHTSRGTVMIYEMEQSAAAEQHRELIMASAIREALDERRLTLYAQPIANTSDTEVINHFEILVRMVDDYGKLILPAAFIPAAERYGLMLQIDRWVIDEVLVRRSAQIVRSGLSFFLNISADALGDGEFQEHLIKVLEQTPIPLSRIGFEITETAMVNQMDSASHFVATLRKMGCKVALDDFGNGLSSFSYLKAFAIDFIKIDGSFVRQVESNFVDLIIVESINQVAHRLGASTIAEYVEDAATAARLRTIGVNLVQGYYIGRPVSLAALLAGEVDKEGAEEQPRAVAVSD